MGNRYSSCSCYNNHVTMIGIAPVRKDNEYAYITLNYRHIIENKWLDDLQYLCEPTKHHEKRISVKFICDRGVSHEYVRNRGEDGNGFAQESTRYCNYSKDKFGNEINIMEPCWVDNIDDMYNPNDFKCMISSIHRDFTNQTNELDMWKELDYWFFANYASEFAYVNLIRLGWQAQKARSILPTDLKTELVITGTISDWKHFFSLRDDKAAHPSARELAAPLHQNFINRGWL